MRAFSYTSISQQIDVCRSFSSEGSFLIYVTPLTISQKKRFPIFRLSNKSCVYNQINLQIQLSLSGLQILDGKDDIARLSSSLSTVSSSLTRKGKKSETALRPDTEFEREKNYKRPRVNDKLLRHHFSHQVKCFSVLRKKEKP
jgi:hypothetical protein